MERFIPYKKLSKKKQRELDQQKRTTWQLSPITRKPENPKAYNRRKARQQNDDSTTVLFLYIIMSLFVSSPRGSASQALPCHYFQAVPFDQVCSKWYNTSRQLGIGEGKYNDMSILSTG